MTSNFDLNKLWINPQLKIERNTSKSWANLRIKKDKKTGKHYFDILIGIKGRKEWHTHIGIDLTQILLFNEFRKQVGNIGRKDDSVKNGIIFDKEVIVDPSKKPLTQLKFKPWLNGTTGEVTVHGFDIIDL